MTTLEYRMRRTLNVHSPFLWIESECFQGSLLAESLRHVNKLITSIIPSTRITFRVFICHGQISKHERGMKWVLCITLPRASRTAREVKFSEGIRLMKCFCRLFSCFRASMRSTQVSSYMNSNLLQNLPHSWITLFKGCGQ